MRSPSSGRLPGTGTLYRALVDRHSRNIYRLAFRMLGNRQDAEEVMHEIICVATKDYAKQFAGNSNFGTWVYHPSRLTTPLIYCAREKPPIHAGPFHGMQSSTD